MKTDIKKTLSSLDLAISLLTPIPKTDDEFTLVEYMQKTKVGERNALRQLNCLLADGSFVKRKALIGGCFYNLYRKAD